MSNDSADRETETDLQDSTPNSSGPARAAGEMGVSSERTGPTGPGQHATDGVRDTSLAPDAAIDGQGDEPGDVPPEQRPGAVEENPEGVEPKAGYPSLDPRSNG